MYQIIAKVTTSQHRKVAIHDYFFFSNEHRYGFVKCILSRQSIMNMNYMPCPYQTKHIIMS